MSQLIERCYNYSKRKPIHIILMVIVLLLSYGFYATNYTFHLDQLVTEYYNGNVMIGAGRWAAPVIHLLTNWMNFSPFWHTLLMAVLLFVSALVFGQVFIKASNDKLPDCAILVFSVIYISYPIITAQITFPILNIALSYLLSSIALWILTSEEKLTVKNMILTVVMLTISVDLYESFATVFLVGFFGTMLIKNIFTQEKASIKEFILKTVKGFVLLLIAIIADYIVSKIFCLIYCGTINFWYDSNTELLWSHGIIDTAIWLVRNVFFYYVIGAHSFFFIFLFDITIIVGLIVFLILSIKQKNIFSLLIYICIAISSLALAIITGRVPEYRQSQAIPVFVSLIIMILFCMIPNKKSFKAVFSVLLIIITLNQTKIINNYAVDNFERHEYEVDLLRDVGKELSDYSITTKPVAFVMDTNFLPASLKSTRSETHPIVKLYQSAFEYAFDRIIPKAYFKKMGEWYDTSFETTKDLADYLISKPRAYYSFIERTSHKEHYIPDMYRAMSRLGYSVINCTDDEYEMAKETKIENPDNDLFCIKETDSVIVIRFFDVAY